MTLNIDLTGRRALVTGAGQNVGRGIARMLATAGAEVLVNDLLEERTQKVVGEIEAAGGRARSMPFDVTDYDAVKAAFDEADPVDILVNNAGNAGSTSLMGSFDLSTFVETTPESWDRYIKINYYGVLNTVHVALPAMIEARMGSRDHADLGCRARRRPAHRGVRGRESGGGRLHAGDRP